MPVVSLQQFRASREAGADAVEALAEARLSDADCEAAAAGIEFELARQRIRYDHQAEGLSAYGIDPPSVLGPRP